VLLRQRLARNSHALVPDGLVHRAATLLPCPKNGKPSEMATLAVKVRVSAESVDPRSASVFGRSKVLAVEALVLRGHEGIVGLGETATCKIAPPP
jgi:hypothetical protein